MQISCKFKYKNSYHILSYSYLLYSKGYEKIILSNCKWRKQ